MIYLYITLIIGIIVFSVGITVFVSPAMIRTIIGKVIDFKWIWPATIVRLFTVWVLFYAAPYSKMPWIIYIFGVLILIAAGVIPVLGKKTSDELVKFWHDSEISMLRLWGAFSITVGLLLIYACWI